MDVIQYDVGPGAYGVARADDGAVWTSLTGRGELARDGSLAEEISFEPGSEPHGIALGPGGSIWVALEAGFLAHLIP